MVFRNDNNAAGYGAHISGSICGRDDDIVEMGGHAVILLCFFNFTNSAHVPTTTLGAIAATSLVILTAK